MKALWVLIALICLVSACSDPVKVPENNGVYETYFEEVNVGLRIDFNNSNGPKITVANDNDGPVGVALSLYERPEAVVFKDLYIGGQDASSAINSFLDRNRDAHLWIDIYVYNSTVASWVYWAISHLPDTWEEWLNDTFGQSWLLNYYYTDIQLSA